MAFKINDKKLFIKKLIIVFISVFGMGFFLSLPPKRKGGKTMSKYNDVPYKIKIQSHEFYPDYGVQIPKLTALVSMKPCLCLDEIDAIRRMRLPCVGVEHKMCLL